MILTGSNPNNARLLCHNSFFSCRKEKKAQGQSIILLSTGKDANGFNLQQKYDIPVRYQKRAISQFPLLKAVLKLDKYL